MNGQRTVPRRLATTLFGCARRLMPKTHVDWVDAMQAECGQIDGDYLALRWALGCLASAVTWRVRTMAIGDLRISRWVLAPELLLCFGPLAFGWFHVVFGTGGVTKLTPQIIDEYFLNTPGGTYIVYMLLEAVLGTLGPVAFMLGAVFVVSGRPIFTRRQTTILISSAALLALLLTTRLVVLLLRGETISIGDLGGYASALLLLSVLPAAGLAHVHYLGRHARWVKAPV